MLNTLAVYTALLVVIVMLGVSLSRRFVITHRRTQLTMSFVSGIMLGIALFHLLPHSIYAAMESPVAAVNADFVALWLMVGVLGMFLLQRLFHFHQHDFNENYAGHQGHEGCDHQIETPPVSDSGVRGAGVFLGLAVHSAVDGVALAAAILADSHGHAAAVGLAGLGVFVAIALHKPLDAITIDMFARRRGLSSFSRRALVLAYVLICPAVATLVILGVYTTGEANTSFIIASLAFAAGIFLCIALSDLLPEIHFHQHDRMAMTFALMLGISIAYGITFLESEASHHMDLGETFHHGEDH